MKVSIALLLVIASMAAHAEGETVPQNVAQVVKYLGEMAEASQREGIEERDLYAMFKCHCDSTEATRKKEIESAEDTIAIATNDITKLRAENGKLSTECAKLKADIDEITIRSGNLQSQREDETQAYTTLKDELEASMGLLTGAIEELEKVGGNQLTSSGADHEVYLRKHGGTEDTLVAGNEYIGTKYASLQMSSKVRSALTGASGVVGVLATAKQHQIVDSFLQHKQPWGSAGTYTAQSAEVTGILINMKDNLESQKARAKATEESSEKRYQDIKNENDKSKQDMQDLYDSKQATLGNNDDALTAKRATLASATSALSAAQTLLKQLLEQCATKKAEYEERVMQRANEEHAIQEAIQILDSDDATDLFRGIAATSFLQVMTPNQVALRHAAKSLMRKGSPAHQERLSKIASMLQQGNAFAVVLQEIAKMKEVIAAEEVSDKQHDDWCTSERSDSDATITSATATIIDKESEVTSLLGALGDEDTGLEDQIKEKEEMLSSNRKDQADQTASRKSAHLLYQKTVARYQKTKGILEMALVVLKKHWSDTALVQKRGNLKVAARRLRVKRVGSKAAPDTWDHSSGYDGQKVKGDQATQLLKFILDETVKEENEYHATEQVDQHQYEDAMEDLKTLETTTAGELVNLRGELAEKQMKLAAAKKALKEAKAQKTAAEGYKEKIKPGCDFIATNKVKRENARKLESDALDDAVAALKASPTYVAWLRAEELKGYGKCADKCETDPLQAECKACLAGVSVVGYCTSHPTTSGCP